MNEQVVKKRPRPSQESGPKPVLSEKQQGKNKFVNAPKDGQYVDDLSMFMGWHNWCLIEHNRFLSNLCMLQFSQQQMLLQQLQQSQQHQVLNAQVTDEGQTQHQTAENRGVQATIAPFKKRLAAELIDFCFLLFVKLFVITYVFGDTFANHFQYILIIDENTTFEDLQLTLLQALLFRVVSIAYEGYCLSGTLPFSNSATVGKRIMGLEVMRCEHVEDVDAVEGRVRVLPGGTLGVARSIVRAILKNAIISIFFPILLPFQMIANNNRLIYDIASGTIVTEKE